MKTVMGQAGGGKTMHQRCALSVLGSQKKGRLFIVERYLWGNPLKAKMEFVVKPEMSQTSRSRVNVGRMGTLS